MFIFKNTHHIIGVRLVLLGHGSFLDHAQELPKFAPTQLAA